MILHETRFSNTMTPSAVEDTLASHVLDPTIPEPILLAFPPGFRLPDPVSTQMASSGPFAHAEFLPDGSARLDGHPYPPDDTAQELFARDLLSLAHLAHARGLGTLLAERVDNARPAAFRAFACAALAPPHPRFPTVLATCSYGCNLPEPSIAACRRIGVDVVADPPDIGIRKQRAIRRSR